ncbi:MAG TPA: hypothetical protein VGR26_17265 [Acidimicrobiales bacterium]|nr:hypothetical protein [Acidimicrobiales bacterium]
MNTVLMLAQWFPPCQAWPTAATRVRLLASHLPEYGWRPIVLAPDMTGGACSCAWCSDPGRARPLDSAALTVHRLPVRRSLLRTAGSWVSRSPAHATSTPTAVPEKGVSTGLRHSLATMTWLLGDVHSNWTRVAASHAGHLLDRGTIDAIWTTSAPFGHINLGHRLAHREGVPWVADIRDPVSKDVTAPPGWLDALVTARRRRYRRPLVEATAITAATGQVAVLDGPWLGRDATLLVPGFDEAEWAVSRAAAERKPERFEIVFTGKLYENYRRPDTFLRGLRLAVDTLEPAERGRIRFVYYGRSGGFLGRVAEEVGCADVVEDRGFVDPVAVPQLSAEATALLLLTNEVGDSGVPGGKFFEYLAAHRPILAVPGSDRYVASVLTRTGAGYRADDERQVADILIRWFSQWRRDGALPFAGDTAAIAEFSARTSARRLAELLGTADAGAAA